MYSQNHEKNQNKNLVVNIGDSEFLNLVVRWREQDISFMFLQLFQPWYYLFYLFFIFFQFFPSFVIGEFFFIFCAILLLIHAAKHVIIDHWSIQWISQILNTNTRYPKYFLLLQWKFDNFFYTLWTGGQGNKRREKSLLF